MGRLILHVGTHKTGTTSIQRALALHRRRLRERGIRYPDYTGIGLPSHYAHIGVANALAEQHPQISAEDAVRFFEFVRGQVGDYSATIISAEPMYRQTLGAVAPQSAPDAAAYWEMRDAYIARLRALTGPAEIVLVVRRQDEFAESMYQEHVKVTRYSGSFQTYLRQFWFHSPMPIRPMPGPGTLARCASCPLMRSRAKTSPSVFWPNWAFRGGGWKPKGCRTSGCRMTG